MELLWKLPLIAAAGYLLGNIQTGVIVSKTMGRFDVRRRGSKSAGTTNVLRTMGWLPSMITLVGDVLKSVAAALIGLYLGGPWGGWGARLGGLCAVLGHNWPAFFGFQGGKGIAASLGLILVIDPPWVGAALVACQAIVLAITRTMSVASLASASVYAVLSLIVHWGQWPEAGYALLVSALAFFSHRSNIERISKKRENKLDFKEISDISKKFYEGKGKDK